MTNKEKTSLISSASSFFELKEILKKCAPLKWSDGTIYEYDDLSNRIFRFRTWQERLSVITRANWLRKRVYQLAIFETEIGETDEWSEMDYKS